MSLTGARNQTKQEIINTVKIEPLLHLISKDELVNLNDLVKNVLQEVISKKQNAQNKLIVANKVIVDNLQMSTLFEKTLEDVYGAKVDRFAPSLVEETNKWISDLTNHKIEKILDTDFFKSDSCIALINAVYFKYDWMYPFDERFTKREEFKTANARRPLQVDMMQLMGKQLPYLYSESLKAHVFSLPYANEDFSLNIVLPDDANDLLIKTDSSSLIHKLSYQSLKNELRNKQMTQFNLFMPKFKISKKIQVGLFVYPF